MKKHLALALILAACNTTEQKENHGKTEAFEMKNSTLSDSSGKKAMNPEIRINDSLNAIASLIAGTYSSDKLFDYVKTNRNYEDFAASFSKRWERFDSTRIMTLEAFRDNELVNVVKQEKILFYPFSGPDILYANLFFPNIEKFIMLGLEPVGTLPDFEKLPGDSLKLYYNSLNASLHAILQFSFFRTESMSQDLKHGEVDGTIHLLFLFLNRTGNLIVSAKPMAIDSSGTKTYVSFEKLKAEKLKTEGLEITFKAPDGSLRELNYFSVNAADYMLQSNPGFVKYLESIEHFNTYLKGASYLLHKPTFKTVRNMILDRATTVTQDDSGIPLHFFEASTIQWNYQLYGDYSKPIKMFAKHYQPTLDTLYAKQGSKKLDFGIGYNYRDKNSNFMVATRKN